jgi:regulator of protease activity HflC (stomatin/prohibitin superfamily)
MSHERVDGRVKTTPHIPGKALSKDNINMTGEFFLAYLVIDSNKNLSADEPLESLIKFGLSEFRNGIAARDSDDLEDPEGRSKFAAELTKSLQEYGETLGYKVMKASIPEILPPEKIAEANEGVRIEQAQARAEAIERAQVGAWIDDLGERNISPELAIETMQIERGKAVARRNIVRIEGAQGIADAIGGAIGKVAESMVKKEGPSS